MHNKYAEEDWRQHTFHWRIMDVADARGVSKSIERMLDSLMLADVLLNAFQTPKHVKFALSY
jgi:hypothetical protein